MRGMGMAPVSVKGASGDGVCASAKAPLRTAAINSVYKKRNGVFIAFVLLQIRLRLKIFCGLGKSDPQGLKPAISAALGGTAEAVSFRKQFFDKLWRFSRRSLSLGCRRHIQVPDQ